MAVAVAIIRNPEASNPGDAHTISEKPLDVSSFSVGAAFGNI